MHDASISVTAFEGERRLAGGMLADVARCVAAAAEPGVVLIFRDDDGRTLDLDLLLFDDTIIDMPRLRVPHPRMHLRAFVVAPLAEIASDCLIPGRGSVSAWLPAVKMQRIERMEGTATHE